MNLYNNRTMGKCSKSGKKVMWEGRNSGAGGISTENIQTSQMTSQNESLKQVTQQ